MNYDVVDYTRQRIGVRQRILAGQGPIPADGIGPHTANTEAFEP